MYKFGYGNFQFLSSFTITSDSVEAVFFLDFQIFEHLKKLEVVFGNNLFGT